MLHDYGAGVQQSIPILGGQSEDNLILSFIGLENVSTLDFINSNTFELKDMDGILSSADNIRAGTKKFFSINEQLIGLSNAISQNWQNEAGLDIASAIESLRQVTNQINEFLPNYDLFANTFTDLVNETKKLQSQTVHDYYSNPNIYNTLN